MGQMNIAGHSLPRNRSEDLTGLEETVRNLVRVTTETITQARQVQAVIINDYSLSRSVTAFGSLRRKVNGLVDILQSLSVASEDYIVARLFSLDGRDQNVQDLLSYFKTELKSIIRNTLDSTRDDEIALWRAMEECYIQSLSDCGVLHSDNYFITRGEALLA